MTLKQRAFENIMGKGEKAGYQHFPIPTMFSTLPKPKFNFSFTFILSSASAFNLTYRSLKFCLLVKGLIAFCHSIAYLYLIVFTGCGFNEHCVLQRARTRW